MEYQILGLKYQLCNCCLLTKISLCILKLISKKYYATYNLLLLAIVIFFSTNGLARALIHFTVLTPTFLTNNAT